MSPAHGEIAARRGAGLVLTALVLWAASARAATCPGAGFEGALCMTERALDVPFCGPRRLEREFSHRLKRTKHLLTRAAAARDRGNVTKMTASLARADGTLGALAARTDRLWMRHVIGAPCRASLARTLQDIRETVAGIASGTITTTSTSTTLPAGTSTTIPPGACPGMLETAVQTATNPVYPDCVDVVWPVPAPPCAKSLRPAFFDAATGSQLTDTLLFPPATHWAASFQCLPPGCVAGVTFDDLKVVFRVCNHDVGSPGGGTRTVSATVAWD